MDDWVKDIIEDTMGGAPFEIGDIVKHPDGREVQITKGQFYGTHGVSNFWYWVPVNELGQAVGPEEHGYGWTPERPAMAPTSGFVM